MLQFLAEAVARDLDGMLDAILRSLTRRQHGSLWHNVHTSALRERHALLSMTASSRSIGTGPILRRSPWSCRLDLIRLSLLRKLEEGTSANESKKIDPRQVERRQEPCRSVPPRRGLQNAPCASSKRKFGTGGQRSPVVWAAGTDAKDNQWRASLADHRRRFPGRMVAIERKTRDWQKMARRNSLSWLQASAESQQLD